MKLPEDWKDWDEDRKRFLLNKLKYSWDLYSRPDQRPPESEWLVWLLLAGRGAGKELWVDTPIATPSGWTTMGQLEVGDEVFSVDGASTLVTYVSPIRNDRPCCRLTFSDGTSLIADEEHEWVTQTAIERKRASRPTGRSRQYTKFATDRSLCVDCLVKGPRTSIKRKHLDLGHLVVPVHGDVVQTAVRHFPDLQREGVRTTQQIANTLRVGPRQAANHSIQVADPLQLSSVDLPIEPYTLGAWLGDGFTGSSRICGIDDEIFEEIQQAYTLTDDHYEEPRQPGRKKLRYAKIGWEPSGSQIDGVRARGAFNRPLRLMGVAKHKHIPSIYQRSSYDQRLALLQGLMDTDGTISRRDGSADIGFVNQELADGVYELVVGLGMQARRQVKQVGARGGKTRSFYGVSFTPRLVPVVRLPRKAALLRDAQRDRLRRQRRFIESVVQVSSVPTRCIEVAHESHQYLAGESLIPTHNTRSSAEYCRAYSQAHPGVRIGVICPTYGVVRDVAYEGESGVLSVIPPADIETYNRSLHQITLTNGSRFFGYSGADPERLRGPQHHILWCEELAAWQYVQHCWDMAQFGLRLGEHPHTIVSTTPRPLPLIKELIAREAPDDVAITRASTFDNAANLPRVQLEALKRRYAGTYLGMQELQGLVLDDIAGALWRREDIERYRIQDPLDLPPMTRVVIGVDPAASSGDASDETGIVIVGRGADGHGYVLGDRSLRASPDVWGRTAVEALHAFKGDRIVAERNNGGEMVTHVLRTVDPLVPVKTVWASRGKHTRAEPVAALYEQGRMHHVGLIPALEDSLCTWIPGDPRFPSPDRLDALVWACTEVVLAGGPSEVIVATPQRVGKIPRL